MANFEALKRAGEMVDFLIENTSCIELDEKEKHRFDAVIKDTNTKVDLIQEEIDKILDGITDGYENQINHEYAKKFMEHMYRVEMNRLGGENVVKTVEELDTFMSIYKDKLNKMWEKYKEAFWKRYVIKNNEFIKKIQEIRNVEIPNEVTSYRELYNEIEKMLNGIDLELSRIQKKVLQALDLSKHKISEVKDIYNRFVQLVNEFEKEVNENSIEGILSTAQKLEVYNKLKQVFDTFGQMIGIESFSDYIEQHFRVTILDNFAEILRGIFQLKSRLTFDDIYTAGTVSFLYKVFELHADIFIKTSLVDIFFDGKTGRTFFNDLKSRFGDSINHSTWFASIETHLIDSVDKEISTLIEELRGMMQNMTVHVKQEFQMNMTGYRSGIREGYSDGYKEGYREGYETGYKEGYKEGMVEGGKIGAKIGTENGVKHGLQVGRVSQLAEIKEKLLLKGIHL